MEKLKMHSPDLVDANIDKIAAIFPGCITEYKDEKGKLCRAVDFDLLRQELSAGLVQGPAERYTLSWPGKNESILAANAPIAKTLRPCEEESVNFDNTRNLFIEGDNLDVLKLLQETYLGKVKMIYIDPPYNTGNDFIYEDDFAEDTESFLQRSIQKDEEGNRLVANTDSNGRFHSDWLSMMYSRLKLARNLLREDGVIFISIDDNEVHNLKKLCDEIFGEENFLGQLVWHSKKGGGGDVKTIVSEHEYIIAYSKLNSKSSISKQSVEAQPLNQKDEKGLYRKGRELNKWGAGSSRADRPTMFFPIPGPNGEEVFPIRNDGSEGRWRLGRPAMMQVVADGNALFEKREDGTYIVFEKIRSDAPRKKSYRTLLNDAGTSADGTAILKELFEGKSPFNFPKPVQLSSKLIEISGANEEDIILDFFSGSCTTAHAMLDLNKQDNRNRRFIMVQLPEPCDEKSEAFKAGYKTIAEIGKERIRRAGKKIKDENPHKAENLDIGFRVFKVDTSNMKDVFYTPDEVKQKELKQFAAHIKEDRRPEDLLFQVFLDWGIDLALPVSKETISEKTVFFVDENILAACFDKGIGEELVKIIAKRKPLRAVFRDDGFGSDSAKINVEQIFKMLSPGTEVKSI